MEEKNKNNLIKKISIIIITLEVIINVVGFFTNRYINTHPCNPCADSCCGLSDKEEKLLNLITNCNDLLQIIYIIIIIIAVVMLIIVTNKKKKQVKISQSTINLVNIAVILPIILITFAIIRNINNINNNEPTIAYKPIIYIYPTEKTKLKITLDNSDKITHSYPKYNKGWEITVDKNSNIYDINTNRNYYALYWEGIDNTKINEKEGFIIKGKDTTKFLEDKLTYLGLNNKEINEFIIYWLPKLENNKYNYIRFRTKEEIEEYNKINIDHKVDTLIQVYMDYKPLDKKISIKEQRIEKVKRSGFTIVEWGGREIK